MIEAYKFVEKFENVKKVRYNGDILYNVLMEDYNAIYANNLLCETLDPDNIIAKLYNTNIGNEYKNNLIIMMNECIMKNDYNSYKKIVTRI
jgi:hypothetical protein